MIIKFMGCCCCCRCCCCWFLAGNLQQNACRKCTRKSDAIANARIRFDWIWCRIEGASDFL